MYEKDVKSNTSSDLHPSIHNKSKESSSCLRPPSIKVQSSYKTHIAPGYSTLDWEQLKRSSNFPRRITAPYLSITQAELKKHCHLNDAWIVLNGKVYDITPYIPFHPGGNEIMKGAGKDGTKLLSLNDKLS